MISLENSRFSLSTGTIIRFFGIGVLLLALYYIFDIVMVVLAAVVVASALEPVIRRLRYHFGLPRVASVIILYVILFAVLIGMTIYFVPLVLNDALGFLSTIPSTITFEELWNPIFGSLSESVSTHVISLSEILLTIQSALVGSSSGFETAGIVFDVVLSIILILVLSFYLAVQEEGVDAFLKIIAPVRKHDYILNLWKRAQRKIGFWLQGQIILSIIVGVLVYLALKAVGIPYALALAVLAALLEVIPVFGPIVSAVPAVFIGFAIHGPGTALLLIGLYIIIQQFESHIFYPLVVQKVVGINPIIVILALVIGAKLAGLLGAIIAVPLSAALMEYINDVDKRKKSEKSASAAS